MKFLEHAIGSKKWSFTYTYKKKGCCDNKVEATVETLEMTGFVGVLKNILDMKFKKIILVIAVIFPNYLLAEELKPDPCKTILKKYIAYDVPLEIVDISLVKSFVITESETFKEIIFFDFTSKTPFEKTLKKFPLLKSTQIDKLEMKGVLVDLAVKPTWGLSITNTEYRGIDEAWRLIRGNERLTVGLRMIEVVETNGLIHYYGCLQISSEGFNSIFMGDTVIEK